MVDPSNIILGVGAAGAAALGLGTAIRLAPSLAAARRAKIEATTFDDAGKDSDLSTSDDSSKPRGKPRASSIIGMWQGCLRHTDGGYTRGYNVPLAATMLAHEHVIDSRYNRIGRMLAVPKPPGTVISFRLSNDADLGQAIYEHERDRAPVEATHPLARRMQDYGLEFYAGLAAGSSFRRSALTCWVRVPAKHDRDDSSHGLAAAVPTLFTELRKGGVAEVGRAVSRASAVGGTDKLTRRLMRDEQEAFASAEKIFRLVEREVRLEMKRMTEDETFDRIYLGHRQNALSTPRLNREAMFDIHGHLCGESIDSGGWYLMHGSFPVAVISLFTPPQPVIDATMTRFLTAHPNLNFRHTVVAEFVYLDRAVAKKKLDKRIRQIQRSAVRPNGASELTPEGARALGELNQVRDSLTSPVEALVQGRVYALVYGQRAETRAELRSSLQTLEENCERLISTFRLIPGADAEREEPAALRMLYPKMIVGEADARATDREIEEMANSVACFVPTESAWAGSRGPHSIHQTTTGRILPLNLFDTNITPQPVVLVIGGSGSGKSVLMARTACDVLATMPKARVRVIDFSEMFRPLIEMIGGRQLRFVPGEPRTINIWDYPGLELSEMPDEAQVSLVVGDILTQARVRGDDERAEMAEKIIETVVKDVYQMEVPRNRAAMPKHEPTLSHFLNTLRSYPWKSTKIKDRAEALLLSLEVYRDHPWLDAPTHPDYAAHSPLDVYECDSLYAFSKDVRASMGYRVSAWVTRSIGEKMPDGTLSPTLLIFDEAHKYKTDHPEMFYPLNKGARQGRTNNVVTMIGTHAYEDLDAIYGVIKNAGTKIIGTQTGDFSKLAEDTNLSAAAIDAVRAITNVEGLHAQYVLSIGDGNKQVVEMIQSDLSPIELWTYTSKSYEKDARVGLKLLRPEWSALERMTWLAEHYPRGLAYTGRTEIDERLLKRVEPSNEQATTKAPSWMSSDEPTETHSTEGDWRQPEGAPVDSFVDGKSPVERVISQ